MSPWSCDLLLIYELEFGHSAIHSCPYLKLPTCSPLENCKDHTLLYTYFERELQLFLVSYPDKYQEFWHISWLSQNTHERHGDSQDNPSDTSRHKSFILLFFPPQCHFNLTPKFHTHLCILISVTLLDQIGYMFVIT